MPVTMLGHTYVVWFDPKGESWRVMEDRCPHRLAPLSEGRIDADGTLMCS
jgi:pheophorbide a oxygenase